MYPQYLLAIAAVVASAPLALADTPACAKFTAKQMLQMSELTRALSSFRVELRHVMPMAKRCAKLRDSIGRELEKIDLSGLSLGVEAGGDLLASVGALVERRASCMAAAQSRGLRTLIDFIQECAPTTSSVAPLESAGSRDELTTEQPREATTGDARDEETRSDWEYQLADSGTTIAQLRAELAALEAARDAREQWVARERRQTLVEFEELRDEVATLKSSLVSANSANSVLLGQLEARAREVAQLESRLIVLEKSACPTSVVSPEATRELLIKRDPDAKLGLVLESFMGGTFVAQVRADSPAARAGLRFGDQVVQVNGVPMSDHSAMAEALARSPQAISYTVRKSPFEQTVVVRRDPGESADSPLGIGYSRQRVTSVERGSPAARAGLLEDLTVISVNGRSVVGIADGTLAACQDPEVKLTLLPREVYERLLKSVDANEVRAESNRILDQEMTTHG